MSKKKRTRSPANPANPASAPSPQTPPVNTPVHVQTDVSGLERFRRYAGFTMLQILFGACVFVLTKAYYEQPVPSTMTASHQQSRGAATAAAAAAAPRIPASMLMSNNPAELKQLAGQQFQSQDFVAAAATYERILGIDPNDPEVLNNYSLVLHYTGRSEDALQHLRKALNLSPKHQRSWLTLGFVHKGAGRAGEAKQAFDRVLEIDANTSMASEARRLLETL